MSYISKNPKRVLGGLTTILVAAGVAVGSGATFDSSSATAANTFTSGTMTQSNDKAGAKIFLGSNMKPGDSATGTVTIKNTGSIKGTFKLTQAIGTETFTPNLLKLSIKDGTTSVYDGPADGLSTVSLGTAAWAPDESHTYTFTVTLPSSATNADQGKSFSATYTWDEAQTTDAVTQTVDAPTPNR